MIFALIRNTLIHINKEALMLYLIGLVVACGVIVILLKLIESLKVKIKDLERTLAEERRKRTMPLLQLEVNTDDDYGIFLINDSYCYAKNIRVDNLNVVVDYGFKKNITLKFDVLEMLKPNGRARLKYRVFDGDYDTTSSDEKNILNHFPDAPLKMELRYENLESELFTSKITSEESRYVVQEVKPVV